MKRGGTWLGRIIPSILAFCFALDVVLRMLPLEFISFRAWEVVTRYAPYGAPFEPNRQFRSRQEFGDLANLANLPNLREYRGGTTFTTDAFGFRRTPGTYRQGDAGVIVVGDSFGVGATVTDEHTLAAQLASMTGCRVYNASGSDGLMLDDPRRVIALARKLGMSRGVVIDEVLEGAVVIQQRLGGQERVDEGRVRKVPATLADLLVRARGLGTVSPLKILLNRAIRRLEDNRILPNSYEASVVERTLRNGERILFLRGELELARSVPVVAMDQWVRFASDLEEEGLKLLVVLVPRKYTVYEPFLVERDAFPSEVGRAFGGLERQFRDAGISVLNLTSVFRSHAARELDRSAYLYWRDDTHWNARGIGVAAAEINRVWAMRPTSDCRKRS